jgi:DNA replicative helicase MCM subunit Mcm2 (Cdc46/Mcm family)
LEPIREHLRAVIQFAETAGEIKRNAEARNLWHQVYTRLTGDRFGLFGSMTARAEAQVMRLSVLYAMLDMSNEVKVEHLKAALAVWDYCERSAKYIFGTALGNRTADTLLAELRQVPEVGLSRTEMLHSVFNKNKTASEIADALRLLHDNGLAHRRDDPGNEAGRTIERWFPILTT